MLALTFGVPLTFYKQRANECMERRYFVRKLKGFRKRSLVQKTWNQYYSYTNIYIYIYVYLTEKIHSNLFMNVLGFTYSLDILTWTAFVCKYSSTPLGPNSRPIPDILNPPNGTDISSSLDEFIQTVPDLMSRAN